MSNIFINDMGYSEYYKKEETKMNLGKKYKQLFEGKTRSNDSKLLNEALNLSSVKTQLLALSKKYPGYADGLADYMDSGIPEDAYNFQGGSKAKAEKFYDLVVAVVQKVDPSFEAEVDNGFDTEMESFQKIGFFGG